MEDFRSHFKTLHKKEKRFMSHLRHRCVKGSPQDIKYVQVIAKILVPKDSAFSRKNEDMVIKKFYIVREVTTAVLATARPLVVEKYQEWFDRKGSELHDLLVIQTMMAASLRLDASNGDGGPESILSNGVGGINSSVKSTLSRSTLEKLVKLAELLQSLSNG